MDFNWKDTAGYLLAEQIEKNEKFFKEMEKKKRKYGETKEHTDTVDTVPNAGKTPSSRSE